MNNIIIVKPNPFEVAMCPWCQQEEPYCGVKIAGDNPIFKCLCCRKYWAIFVEDGDFVNRKINLKGEVIL